MEHRIRLHDEATRDSFLGFLQRSRCLAETCEDGTVAVFLAYDLPEEIARAEIESYLRLWERSTPGAAIELLGGAVG